jgi:multidrug efflux pump subunit AcrA (membrane-fusion protein)
MVFVAVDAGPEGRPAPPGDQENGRGGKGKGDEGKKPQGPPPMRVEPRRVRIGARADGQVEVLEGLRPGERVVARAGKPLQGGEQVQPSAISEGVDRPGAQGGGQGGRGASGPGGRSGGAGQREGGG